MAGALADAGFAFVDQIDQLPPVGSLTTTPNVVIVVGEDVEVSVRTVRGRPEVANASVLAVVPPVPEATAGAALAAGADDVLLSPPSVAVLGNRVRQLHRAAVDRAISREADHAEDVLLRVHELMAAGGDAPDVLRESLIVISRWLGFDRASLIAHIEGSDKAYVIAATDDPTLSKFTLSIDSYPEVTRALQTRQPVLIADAQTDPLTQDFADAIRRKGIRGVAVFPVIWNRRVLGAMLLRNETPGVDHLTPRKMATSVLFLGDVAAHLADGSVISSLREQTHRISRARYEQERLLRAIDTLREYFEAASDGVVVLDDEGRILFVNRSAESITGFARDGLLGSALVDLVDESQAPVLAEATRTVLGGNNLEAFDLDVATTGGIPVRVSVSTSTVLSNRDAVILQFRDVTAERALEEELRKTKDFLESLIDSTVDAIVAADTEGEIMLFNQGAERIYGFRAEDVIGKINVRELYPRGVAEQVMRMLRSEAYGGVGYLQQTRRELLTKTGELVPVNMTASIIYEDDGHEVATVGIFSDLRDRIKIEQRLLAAQEKLIESEKQGLVAELAGAAAHELNQPLTSILGYLELIKRQMEPHDRHARHIDTIQSEGERMAEIVKKIGRITRYETKEYVGSASILDLDKSTSSSGSIEMPVVEDKSGE